MQGRVFQPEKLVEGLRPLRRISFEFEPEKAWPRNPGYAVRPLGQRNPVKQDHPDHLAKAEGHDGKVVSPQPQDGKAQNNAEKPGKQARERQTYPETEIEIAREKRIGIRTDRVKGYIS